MIAFDILDYECPKGWDKLVKDLCDELALKLEELGLLDEYVVFQAKEKFGGLRWYDNLDFKEINKIIDKYVEMSRYTCIICGEMAEWESLGYISPFCNDCIDEDDMCFTFIPIEEYYGFWEK